MMKKMIAMLALCALVIFAAAGCAQQAQEEPVPVQTTRMPEETAAAAETEPEELWDGRVQTPFADMTVPEHLIPYIQVRISQEPVYTVIFSAHLEQWQQDLFEIRFGDTVNNAVGILETEEAEAMYVGTDFYPVKPEADWPQEQTDLLLSLQEVVNDLLDQLMLEELPAVQEEVSQALTMDTLLGDLQYPEKWETYLQVQTDEEGAVCFFAQLPGREAQLLFRIFLDGEPGHITRQLPDGHTVNVFLAEPAFDDSWTEEEQNLIYAMQEDANYLLDALGA